MAVDMEFSNSHEFTNAHRVLDLDLRGYSLKMVMRNFKSYAGEQHVGPFHKRFSAVVGPHGRGKNNVIDAMLFVFGKQAKLDGETYEAVPGSYFVITRVAYRDNSSKYFTNDRTSNFTEGEVEQISLMKPKGQGPHNEGFLKYLEDIIGSDKYIEKIDESFKQLVLTLK
ncbi:PREDICTED: structural maintenance of chromosomes protein 4-like isoform X2 [Nicotiana attenuata]|uniref:structural maintenance of chromosomes protein 4-like isoform X2 n=1 Tax=Nicotiana attenuata TaxID=49451 RepID=UPI0009052ACE|nr:PREDICTED: structural maintenance of chromosomes protein 4-like isoform X2 [Nicotiana attenuata]